MDSISECRITRFLANIHSLLDDYGKTHAVNSRSSIRVDEDYWYMRGKYMCDKESDKGWPCSSVFNVQLQNTIPLNTTLTLTSTNISYDRTGIECLKKLLFKDCHEARSEFLQLRIKGKPSNIGKKRKTFSWFTCCSCWYKRCPHYEDIPYLSHKSLEYYKAVCPMCVMTIGLCCNQFWNCCIVHMRLGKAFTSITQAVVMSSNCYHFIYERSFIDFCIEGNIYENSRRHSLCYFLNIDRPDPLTSQRLRQLTISKKVASLLSPSNHVALLNPVCKPLMNGAKCVNCDMQIGSSKELFYVLL